MNEIVKNSALLPFYFRDGSSSRVGQMLSRRLMQGRRVRSTGEVKDHVQGLTVGHRGHCRYWRRASGNAMRWDEQVSEREQGQETQGPGDHFKSGFFF